MEKAATVNHAHHNDAHWTTPQFTPYFSILCHPILCSRAQYACRAKVGMGVAVGHHNPGVLTGQGLAFAARNAVI
ncbi:unnamed protein product [Hydatigera taeniaeformis]|uniref:Uncharacterized protein n=1 Tax=Hydatigena taeniaeformis TaxID=6205 RepID=A0A0R3XCT6_HYDTA|nr:unnamed protein product [Hydatigera taeniaeformis]VDM36548.1 unnamed protein product [Hydatigera taeniaeformis]